MRKHTYVSRVIALLVIACSIHALHANEPADKPAPKPGSGGWLEKYWFPAHKENVGRAKEMAGKKVDILLLGDSITQASTRGDTGAPLKEAFKGLVVVNQGVKGDLTQNTLWGISSGEIDGLTPELTILMIGTNNTTGAYKPEETAGGVRAILEEIKKRLPKSKILLLSVLPRAERGPHKLYSTANMKVNEIIKNYADDQTVFYLDLTPGFLDQDGNQKTDLYARDLLHLRKAGYQVWMDLMEPMVKKLLAD